MRVSNNSLQIQWLNALQRQQSDLARTQQQFATGRQVTKPSDDPIGAIRIQQLTRALDRFDVYDRTAGTAMERLSVEEEALARSSDLLNRARELTVQAGNLANDSAGRAAIATEINELIGNLFDVANAQDGRSQYLFAGTRADTQPFQLTATGANYVGNQESRELQIGDLRTIADGDPGSKVFQLVRTGNGTFEARADTANTGTGVVAENSVFDPTLWDGADYEVRFSSPTDYEIFRTDFAGVTTSVGVGVHSPGETLQFAGVQMRLDGTPAAGDSFDAQPSRNQDVFTTLRNLEATLNAVVSDDAGRAQFLNGINQALEDIDRGLDNVNAVRASVGTRLEAIDVQRELNAGMSLQAEQVLMEVRDLDYAEAVTRLERQLFGLESAQAAFSRIKGLSLFNFL